MTCLVRVVQALYVVVQWRSALGWCVCLCVALKEKHVWDRQYRDHTSTHLLKLLPVREAAWYACAFQTTASHNIPFPVGRPHTSVETKARLELGSVTSLRHANPVTYRHSECCKDENDHLQAR